MADVDIQRMTDFTHYQDDVTEYAKKFLDSVQNVFENGSDMTAFALSTYYLKQPFYASKALSNFGVSEIEEQIGTFIRASLATSIVNNYGLTYCKSIGWNICNQCCYALGFVAYAGVVVVPACVAMGHYDCSQLIHYNHQCAFGSYMGQE